MVRGIAHFVCAKSVVILLMKMIICRNVNNVRENVSEDKKNSCFCLYPFEFLVLCCKLLSSKELQF